MKTLLYDLYSAQPDKNVKIHGGGEYIKKLFEYLVSFNNEEYKLIVFYDKDKFLDDNILDMIQIRRVEAYDVKNEDDIQKLLGRVGDRCEYFYTGLLGLYKNIDFPRDMKRIATLHGLRDLEIGFDSYKRYYYSNKAFFKEIINLPLYNRRKKLKIKRTSNLIDKFDRIIVDSKHTRYALRTWLDVDLKKEIMEAYPPPTGDAEISITDEKEAKSLSRYALIISASRYEKNAVRAIFALDNLFSKSLLGDLKVIVCGSIPEKAKNRIVHFERFTEYGYVSGSFLQALYKNCDFFIYPSVNEGFGYPPIEAMKYGKTCVVGAVCSLPEICGDAVYYVNPYDIKEVENRILQACDSKIEENTIKNQYSTMNQLQKESLNKIKDYIFK